MKIRKRSKQFKSVLTVVFSIMFSSCINMFEKEEKTLREFKIDPNNKIQANLISTGATTKDVIQIVIINGNSRKILGVFESYNWVELLRKSDDTLLVKLSDSTSIPDYIDTQYVMLPHRY